MSREEFLKQLPVLIAGYHPSDETLGRISNVTLCMIVGPSGSGKSTLIEHSGFSFIPSDTTRDPRPGEQEGVDMYFRKDYGQLAADIKAGRFVQIAQFATGEMYATRDTAYPESGVAIMPVMADVIPEFRRLGFKKTITVFASPPSYEEWMRRMSLKPLTEEQRAKRLAEAGQSFRFALDDQETRFVLNDHIEAAARQLRDLLNDRVDTQREQRARLAAAAMLEAVS